MANDIAAAVAAKLEEFAPKYQERVHQEKVGMGVHHHRTRAPTTNRVKITVKGGDIQVISLGTNKGEIMTHKGKGKSGNRTAKPFINTAAEDMIPELADEIAMISGDVIAYRLIK